MKEILNKQITWSHGNVGTDSHVKKCIEAEICPACGNDIFINQGEIDKSMIRTTFFECSTCEWKNYEYAGNRL